MNTRLNELEATVRGLTQELVEANERIRHLEAALDEGEAATAAADGAGALSPEQRNGSSGRDEGGEDSSGTSTKHTSDDRQADEEAGSDLDDIIVA